MRKVPIALAVALVAVWSIAAIGFEQRAALRHGARIAAKTCTASIAIEAPITGPAPRSSARSSYHFAQFAVAHDNSLLHLHVSAA